jgi:glycosyltransferase involved in cell wall biosynthesis
MPEREESVDPGIAVIIPARNEEENLPRLLEMLKGEEIDELIVVDDASTDRTREIAEKGGATVLHNAKAIGPGACRNMAIERTASDYILFLDADTLPVSGITLILRKPLDEKEGVVAAVGVYSDDPVINTPFQRYRSRLSTVYHAVLEGDEVDIFLTAMGMVRRSTFMDAGCFDLSYTGADIEDLEFGDRLSKCGRILLLRNAEVGHVYPEFFENLKTYFDRAGMFAVRARSKGGFDKYQVTKGLAFMRISGAGALVSTPLLALPPLTLVPVVFGAIYTIVGWNVLKVLVARVTFFEAARRVFYDLALSAASAFGAAWGLVRLGFRKIGS